MKAKKVLLSALCLTLAFSAFASCGTKGGDTSSTTSSTTSSSAKKEWNWEPEKLTSNGENLSSYKIVVAAEAGESVNYAAEVMQKYMKEATDVEIPVITDATSEGENEILIGETNRSEDDEIDFEALGDESFVVKSVGKDLVIAGNKRGSLYGVYNYLEALGFRFYTAYVGKTPKKNDVFIASDADLSWDPVFTYRKSSFYGSTDRGVDDNALVAEWAVARRLNYTAGTELLRTNKKLGGGVQYIGGASYEVHSVRKFLPYKSLAAEHPLWFSNDNGIVQVSGADGWETDICWTNEEGLDYMYDQMLQTIQADGGVNKMIDLSMSDTHLYCKCATCTAEQEEYGVSGWYYRAINKIAKKLKVDHPDVMLETLSYSYASKAPDFEMEDNVIIRLCLTMCRWHTDPEECHAMQTEGAKTLKTEQARMTDWEGKAKAFQIYSYPTNWAKNLVSDPTYEALRNNIRFFAENGATGLEAEGFVEENGEFCDLKAYLHSVLMNDPYISEEEYNYHINDFLEGFYGEGWENIRAFLDRSNEVIVQKMEQSKYHLSHWYDYSENFPFADWDKGDTYDTTIIDEFNEYWDDAEADANPQQLERIRQSRIHWTYLELYNTWATRYSNGTAEEKAELVERNKALYEDMKKYGVVRRGADGPQLKEVLDFTRSPQAWWSK